ncbi:unnamed protein product [Phytomonas sp. EM1]|nr:unnamed protein product [Phytomonas sp. EM1]|eukprot:CCW64914.1 unnamed protein product [Phytomonas sp. isolate EM1]
MLDLDSTSEKLLRDPEFLLRLHAKIVKYLATGTSDVDKWRISALFESVDSRYKEPGREHLDMHSMQTLLRPIFPVFAVSDMELRILLHMLPLAEGDGVDGGPKSTIDPVEVFFELRQLIPRAAWQVQFLVRKARSVIFSSKDVSRFEQQVREAAHTQSIQLVNPELARKFLTDSCGFSASEALFLLRYCVEPDTGEGLDAPLLHGFLFSVQIPSTIEYPILAAQVAEATKEPAKGSATGSIALIQALRNALPKRSAVECGDGSMSTGDLDFAHLSGGLISQEFYEVCQSIGVGFSREQSDRLYHYLKDVHAPSLSVRQVVRMFRQYFPAVNSSMLYIIKGAVTQYILRAANGNVLCFTQLYARLQEWGVQPVPIEAYVRALRESGVPETVTDLNLEWLRLKAPTRVDLIFVLCVPLPPSREAIIRKLFERLSTHRGGLSVLASDMTSRFQTSKIESSTLRRAAENCKKALEEYLDELDEASLSYELFAYFWYMISAAVDDDPTYTMLIWHSFSLADRTSKRV